MLGWCLSTASNDRDAWPRAFEQHIMQFAMYPCCSSSVNSQVEVTGVVEVAVAPRGGPAITSNPRIVSSVEGVVSGGILSAVGLGSREDKRLRQLDILKDAQSCQSSQLTSQWQLIK